MHTDPARGAGWAPSPSSCPLCIDHAQDGRAVAFALAQVFSRHSTLVPAKERFSTRHPPCPGAAAGGDRLFWAILCDSAVPPPRPTATRGRSFDVISLDVCMGPARAGVCALLAPQRAMRISIRLFVSLCPLDGCVPSPAVFDDGREAVLLVLAGTIPTTVRGIVYHTPVKMYMLLDFPRSPPLCYVNPTQCTLHATVCVCV